SRATPPAGRRPTPPPDPAVRPAARYGWSSPGVGGFEGAQPLLQPPLLARLVAARQQGGAGARGLAPALQVAGAGGVRLAVAVGIAPQPLAGEKTEGQGVARRSFQVRIAGPRLGRPVVLHAQVRAADAGVVGGEGE